MSPGTTRRCRSPRRTRTAWRNAPTRGGGAVVVGAEMLRTSVDARGGSLEVDDPDPDPRAVRASRLRRSVAMPEATDAAAAAARRAASAASDRRRSRPSGSGRVIWSSTDERRLIRARLASTSRTRESSDVVGEWEEEDVENVTLDSGASASRGLEPFYPRRVGTLRARGGPGIARSRPSPRGGGFARGRDRVGGGAYLEGEGNGAWGVQATGRAVGEGRSRKRRDGTNGSGARRRGTRRGRRSRGRTRSW